MTVREKLLTGDWTAWNHPRRAVVATLILAVVGFALSSVAVPHVVNGEPWTGLAVAGAGIAFLVGGLAVLALID